MGSLNKLPLLSTLFVVAFMLPNWLLAAQLSSAEIEQLDLRFKVLSSDIYRHYSSKPNADLLISNDIKQLAPKIRRLIAEDNHFDAIVHIKANLNAIKANIDDASIFDFIAVLLKYNERSTADAIYREIQVYGEQFFIDNAAFVFAKHHAEQQEWQKARKFLNSDFEGLAADDAHHAYILNGMALQHAKQHREAIKIYEKVPDTSKHYVFSKLNIAIAFIRQGWWTDAHLLINRLLAQATTQQHTELSNRLYLILGYSLLNREYYRESRDAFRNISLDSQYINKALLGIGLTAASQGDYISALNALSILKEKNIYDLTVEESYLLFPYVYEKLNQHLTASASYSESMAYYQNRINQINDTLNRNSTYSIGNMQIKNKATLLIQETSLQFTELYPQSFLDNIVELNRLKKTIAEPRLQRQIDALYKAHNRVFNKMIINLFKQRAKVLNSYLSQSRYGLAQLYDNTSLKEE